MNIDICSGVPDLVFYNYTEPHSLYPYIEDRGYHTNSNRALLYNLYSNYKVGTFVSPDIYIEQNSKLVLDSMGIKSEIKIISYPWYFLNQYFKPSKKHFLILKDIDIPVTKHAILFTGLPKMNRAYILSELCKEKNLLWSSVSAVAAITADVFKTSVKDLEYNYNKKVKEYILKDDKFILNVDNNDNKPIIKGFDDMVNDCYFVEPRFFKYNPEIYLHKLREGGKDPVMYDKQVPIEFLESAVYFACETQTVAAGLVTEKTIKGLFYKKPFLIYSVRGYHKWLKDNGFELYDELFDYSFDDRDDSNRIQMYVNECRRILNMDLRELKDKIEQVKSKIEYNYNRCEEISGEEKEFDESRTLKEYG